MSGKPVAVYDFIVVGAGIVGVSTAFAILERRPGSRVAVIEKADHVAAEQTGHCSHVLHAGVYYAPGSLKARFCKEGNAWTSQFCAEHQIPLERCGKMIVATTPLEVARLKALEDRMTANDLPFEHLTGDELRAREPNVEGLAAAFVKDTAITDFRQVTQALVDEVRALGGEIFLDHEVARIGEAHDCVRVLARQGGDRRRTRVFQADRLVLCGGIQADRLAQMAGIDIDFAMVPFRGEYYRLPPEMADIARSLIYPVPDPDMPFLGVHLTRMVDGSQTVGPNAVVGFSRTKYPKLSVTPRDVVAMASFRGFWRLARGLLRVGINEQWDSLVKRSYVKRVQKYCRQVTVDDLGPYPCGIRAQAVRDTGEMVEDFELRETRRIVLVANAPSPACTSARPISGHIVDRLLSDDLGTVGAEQDSADTRGELR